MHPLVARILLAALLVAAAPASAQPAQSPAAPAPPASAVPPAAPVPAFASANVTAEGARALAANCAICHGPQGRAAPGSTVPSLAGRSAQGIVVLMAAYRDGKIPGTIMHQLAKAYSDAEIAAIADYFAAQQAARASGDR